MIPAAWLLSSNRRRPLPRPARSRTGALILALAVPLLLAACGKRGDPLPPLRKTPQPVSGLRLAQRGDALEIAYVAPRSTTEGASLPVLDVELLRADVDGDFTKLARRTSRRVAPGEALVETFPLPPAGTTVRVAARALAKGRPSPLTSVVTLRIAPAPEAPSALRAGPSAEGGVRLVWTPPTVMPTPAPTPESTPLPTPAPGASPHPESTISPAPGATPTAVPSLGEEPAAPAPPAASSEGAPAPPESEPSAPPDSVPPAGPSPGGRPTVADVAVADAASSGGPGAPEAAASLQQPPAGTPPGGKPVPTPTPVPTPRPPTTGFLVYRRPQGGSYGRPLMPVPLQEPIAADAARPGESWCYVVRTVASTDPLIESAPTAEACLAVTDVVPPAAPTGTAVLARDGALEVSWSPSAESDIAGYRVYRAPRGPQAGAGGRPERLADVPTGTTTYKDTTARRGTVSVYTVTAVDTAGNESPPSAGAQGSPE